MRTLPTVGVLHESLVWIASLALLPLRGQLSILPPTSLDPTAASPSPPIGACASRSKPPSSWESTCAPWSPKWTWLWPKPPTTCGSTRLADNAYLLKILDSVLGAIFVLAERDKMYGTRDNERDIANHRELVDLIAGEMAEIWTILESKEE